MILSLKGNANETQNKASTEAQTIETREIGMDHVERILLQNQKALAATLSDIQNNYSVTLSKLLQNNAQLTNQVMAFEVQIRGIQIRLAQMNNGSSTTE